ncbi:phosphoenolpyruvate carboxylase [Shigella sonnei]
MLTTLQNLSNDELLPVACAFSQFLNLGATPLSNTTAFSNQPPSNPTAIACTLRKLKTSRNVSEDTIKKAVESLSLELVLTAHPNSKLPVRLINKMVEKRSGLLKTAR